MTGEHQVEVEVDVLPSCSSCTQKEEELPGWFAARVEALIEAGQRTTKFRLVSGDAEGDGKARAELRLVEEDEPLEPS